MAVSFTPSQADEHQVSVTFRGKHLQGSPFNIEVVDRPVYRRDSAKSVTNRPVDWVRRERVMGNSIVRFLLCAIRGERLLSLSMATTVFSCLT